MERGGTHPSNGMAHVLDLMNALAEEASPAAFAEIVLRFRDAAGAESDDVARLAVRIHETLAERRRRETALAALSETASDLTSMRDVGAVLLAIVKRARRLIGTDAGYLTLVDAASGDDGEGLYTRVTDGISGTGFRKVAAIGIGRWVIDTGSPQTTSDYFADRRFAHVRGADEVVAEEGLVAILAVPVVLHGDVIGILSVADRAGRTFTPREVALLASLAAHAGVAIENARLFEAAERTLEQLKEATAEAQLRRAAAEQGAEIHTRLTRIVLDGGGVSEVAAATAEATGRPVEALDASGRRLAAAGEGEAVWRTDVVAGTERLGLLAVGGQEPTGFERRLFERVAQVIALVLLQRRVVFEAEHRTRSELIRDLLIATPADEHIVVERARRFGIEPDEPSVVAVLDCSGPSREQILLACDALQRRFGGVVAEHDGHLVLLLPSRWCDEHQRATGNTNDNRDTAVTDDTVVANQFLDALKQRLPLRVLAGVAGPVCSAAKIRTAHVQATRCLSLLHALERTEGVARESDFGAYGLLLGAAAPSAVAEFVSTQLGALLEHDSRTGAALVTTLNGWFASGQNMARTASDLHVHVNTLYQRFDRIDRLLGRHWREPEAGLHLQLALRLHSLRTGEQ
ncbi:MAG: hypothetical protein QOI75_7030 [Pseudonocardiales bacterium]|nr:hypothetical protein [Pseudonocardiales bacterium]